jgi:hypothetical protein
VRKDAVHRQQEFAVAGKWQGRARPVFGRTLRFLFVAIEMVVIDFHSLKEFIPLCGDWRALQS